MHYHPIEVTHRSVVHLLNCIRCAVRAINEHAAHDRSADDLDSAAAALDAMHISVVKDATPCASSKDVVPCASATDAAPHAHGPKSITINDQVSRLADQLITISAMATATYHGGASAYLVEYYCDTAQANDQSWMVAAYWNFMNGKNILGSIESCLTIIAKLIGMHGYEELSSIVADADDYRIVPLVEPTRSSKCECNGQFILHTENDEKKCTQCGMTMIIYGAIFDDAQMNSEIVQKVKGGRHHPSTHCRTWVGRIQAWPGPDIPGAVYDWLRKCIARDRTNQRKLRCDQIRKWLKEGRFTDYNNFVPYIRKVLTGIAPPQLTPEELEVLFTNFNRVTVVLKRLRPDNNITYYPSIICKLLDQQLPFGQRKARILECIHLQSAKTMRLIDQVYAQVCAEIDGLQAKPTDKHEYRLML